MILIGFLHQRKNPRRVVKTYAFASVAKAEGVELLYFNPKQVNFETRTISGYIYENGDWHQVESRFPDVIYNTGSPEKLANYKTIIEQLRAEIPFTTYSIGNKMSVYRRLKEAGEFNNYLIPTKVIFNTNDFFDFLNQYKKIVFKPQDGHKGQGVTYIEKTQDLYMINRSKKSEVVDYFEIKNYISRCLQEESYLAQPYIRSKTKNGITFDLRLHVQKDGSGDWVVTAIYPRFSLADSIVANINSGGATNYLIPFLKQEYPDEFFDLRRYLEVFALQLARHLDKIHIEKYNETIDEIGIDVGLDDMRKIWIYEVNWRPGCPPTFYLELDVVKNTIHYAMYLANQHKLASGSDQ